MDCEHIAPRATVVAVGVIGLRRAQARAAGASDGVSGFAAGRIGDHYFVVSCLVCIEIGQSQTGVRGSDDTQAIELPLISYRRLDVGRRDTEYNSIAKDDDVGCIGRQGVGRADYPWRSRVERTFGPIARIIRGTAVVFVADSQPIVGHEKQPR